MSKIKVEIAGNPEGIAAGVDTAADHLVLSDIDSTIRSQVAHRSKIVGHVFLDLHGHGTLNDTSLRFGPEDAINVGRMLVAHGQAVKEHAKKLTDQRLKRLRGR